MKTFAQNTLLILFSVLFGFFILEGAARLYSGSVELFQFENFIRKRIGDSALVSSNEYHPNLGYIPKPIPADIPNEWDATITILDHGIRSNGNGDAIIDAESPIIMAVGDSFTYGAQVSDHETWPAYLSHFLGRAVVNAGVFGYGFDQIVLRAEELSELFEIELLIVDFIPDDLFRNELSFYGGSPKPYFSVEEGRLVRKNYPVSTYRPNKNQIGPLRSVLGYSYLLIWSFDRLGLTHWWLHGQWASLRAHTQGVEVACLLTERLQSLAARTGARIVLIAQHQMHIILDDEESRDDRANVRTLFDCARSNGLEVFDLYEALMEVHQSNPKLYESYFFGHMTAKGNLFVAEQIADYLARQ